MLVKDLFQYQYRYITIQQLTMLSLSEHSPNSICKNNLAFIQLPHLSQQAKGEVHVQTVENNWKLYACCNYMDANILTADRLKNYKFAPKLF